MEWENAGVSSGVAGLSLWLELRPPLEKDPQQPGGIFILSVSVVLLRLQKNLRVIGSLEFLYLGHLQWFVFYSCPSDFPGLFWFCVPNPATCSFSQSINKESLRLLHKCQCMDWPLRKLVMGAVAVLLGRRHIPSMMSPAPPSRVRTLVSLRSRSLILVMRALASSACAQ